MEYEKSLTVIIKNIITVFQNIDVSNIKIESININCIELENYLDNDIRDSNQFREIFKQLLSIKNPVLYWFEIISPTTPIEIYEALENYKRKPNRRIIPVFKQKAVIESKILYVGKAKRDFWVRVIAHLGYIQGDRSHGLQLYHWAKELNLNLKLHFCEFNNDMQDFIPLLEFSFASQYHPVIGKHKF